MGSRVIQFVWHQRHGAGTFEVKCHTAVAALCLSEWDTVQEVSAWLQQRKREVIVNIEPTRALGGDLLDLPSTLSKLVDQFGYETYEEDNATLTEYGFHRRAPSPADPLPGGGEESETQPPLLRVPDEDQEG